MRASEREGGQKRSGASPASARRRLRARTGPCLTAKTPDFGLGSSITVATSPAANISGRAAADHGDAPHLAPPRPLAQPFPAREKRLDRADTERVFCGGGRIAGARPGVEGQDVVAKTLAPGRGHLAPRGIDAGRGVQEKARACARGERSEIDAAILGPVVPRDDAGNHARAESVAARSQQGKVNSHGRRIAEAFQYSEMAVPSADEKKMFHRVLDGCWVILTGVIHF